MNNTLYYPNYKVLISMSKPLSGKTIAITGTLSMPRKNIVDIIQDNGGIVAPSVTKKVTHLLCANPSETSTKLDKARAMGVNIVGPDFLLPFVKAENDSLMKVTEEKEKEEKVTVKKAKTDDRAKATKTKATKTKETTEKKESPKTKKTAKKVSEPKKITVRAGKNSVVEEVDEFIKLMTESNSNLEKKNVFKQYVEQASSGFKLLLKMIYNKQSKFHITPANVLKYEESKYQSNQYSKSDIVDFCSALTEAEISGHEALQVACSLLKDYPDYRNTLLTIFDKDLKIRFGLNLVNDAIPNFVSVFNVSLGAAFNDKTKECTNSGNWFISKKLDGVRCITFIRWDENNDITEIESFSRGGLQFGTLGKVHNDIRNKWVEIYPKVSHLGRSIVLDGEMCVINDDGSENFRSIVSEIKRKNYTVDKPRYLGKIFDFDQFS